MAKKAYVGVNGQPHNGTALYVGVNNVPRKVVKGYVGVNGLPCVFWDKSAPPIIIPSWDYWTSLDEYIISRNPPTGNYDWDFSKAYRGIGYYAIFKYPRSTGSSDFYYALLMMARGTGTGSGDSFSRFSWIRTDRRTGDTSSGTSSQSNGNAKDPYYSYNAFYWFFCAAGAMTTDISWFGSPSLSPSDILLSDTVYDYSSTSGKTALVQDFMGMIYSTPFQDTYQTGRTYTLHTDSINKMLRKALSAWLHHNIYNPSLVNQYANNPAYQAVSDNVYTIINYILNAITTNCGSSIVPLVQIVITGETEIAIYVQFGTTWSIGTTDQVTGCALTYTENVEGYTKYYFETHDYPEGYFVYETSAYPDWLTLIEADSSGNLTYSTMDAWETQANMIKFAAGLGIEKPSGSNFYNVEMTNLGINL